MRSSTPYFSEKTNRLTAPRRHVNLRVFLVLLIGLFGAFRLQSVQAQPVAHVVHISVDALGAKYLQAFLNQSPDDFRNFRRMIQEGASTMNARTDYASTITLVNHTSMLTGRPSQTPEGWPEAKGHNWKWNGDFPSKEAPASLHAVNAEGGYTASVFDVAHDGGLKTALYSNKHKFAVFTISYGPEYGAENPRGRNKVDYAIIKSDMHREALADMKKHQPNYVFLHYAEPDIAGHSFGYLGLEYRNSVKTVDGYLGELLDFVETDPEWKGRTVLILSADHGGKPESRNHGSAAHPFNYTIPFLVWGAGVAKGADLYKINATSRSEPNEANPDLGRPDYAPTGQPIRNGDGGNLALKLLGLPAIPGSHINNKQDLNVH